MTIVEFVLNVGISEVNMSNIDTAKLWIQGMNEHNVEKMFALCTDDLFGEEIADPHPNLGLKAVADTYIDLFMGFPNCMSQIITEFASGDHALIEVRWTGMNSGPFRGELATNKPVDCRIAYIFEFRDQKICHITEFYDGATVAAQMS
jgi:ketosteroid isomerase-like protein